MEGKVDNTILIDDSEIDLFIQRRFLEVYAFTNNITAYKSAQEAIEALQQPDARVPDIIFLDLNMPNIDGFGFLQNFDSFAPAVREHCKIVVLTSSNNKKDKDEALKYSNVVHYITKPFKQSDIDDLKEVLSQKPG
ncbi:MAG: response regulator [Cyclobacteriaceae bacterium]|nr:response regulator [Cyclobacteriaceae bacterium]